MSSNSLKNVTIDVNALLKNSDSSSNLINGLFVGADGASTETLELSSTPDINKHNSFATLKKIYDFQYKLSSSDSWTTGFNSNDSVVLNKYVDLYKEKTGIDLYDLSNYSFDELVEMGVFQQNGDFIPDREMVEQIMKDNNFNNYFESGYGVDVFCSWVRDNASIKFDNNTTIKNTKFCDLKSLADNNGYVKSDDENNVLATDESNSIIQTTNLISNSLYEEGYAVVFNEYIKSRPISELVDADGKMNIDENDLKQFVLKYNSEHPDSQLFGDEYSVTKQTHSLALTVNNLDIKYDSIIEDRHINGTFGDLYNEEKKFSDASDYDQIYLNCFNNDLTNGVKERFGRDSNSYKVYCKFLEGKKIGDIIKDGHFVASKDDLISAAEGAGINLTEREMNAMLKYFDETDFGDYSGSATLRNLTIQNVISEESGYDSIIFEKDDEVIITNTCADGESSEDNATIGYSAVKLLCGGNTELLDFLAPALTGSNSITAGLLDSNDIKNAGAYYDGQIVQSYANVISQLKAGKKVHLNCYSLGGGTGFDTFMRIMSNDDIPEEYKANLTCSGFNPYFNMFESDPFFGDREGHEEAIKKVFDNYVDQIDLKCVEGDVVSQFNTLVDGELGKHITYIKASSDSGLTMSDFDDDETGYKGTIMDLIVNGSSRHSPSSMDLDSFNNGYIIHDGSRITMNEILGNDEPSNDLKDIYKGLITPYFNDLKAENEEFAVIIDAVDKYLSENIGTDINYDGLISAISPALSKIVEDRVPDELGKMFSGDVPKSKNYDFSNKWSLMGFLFEFGVWKVKKDVGETAGDLLNSIYDENRLANCIEKYYSSDEGKEDIKSLLTLLSVGDDGSRDKAIDQITNKIRNMYIADLISIGIDIYKNISS